MRDSQTAAGAWLALWNGFDPARDAEYNDWHAREHVPERLTVPGMLRASRYQAVDDAVYPYFTLYEMASIDVLASPQYQTLLQQPTDWTRRMRASFGALLRIPCQVTVSAAGVRGTALMSLQIRGGDAAALRAGMRGLAAAAGVVGVHSGREETAVAPLPWHDGATMCAAQSSTHLLLVEAQALDDLHALARALPAQIAALQPVLRLHRLLTLHDAPR